MLKLCSFLRLGLTTSSKVSWILFLRLPIVVISTLAEAAKFTGDFAAVNNHMDDLLKIVSLRGGIRSLNTHNTKQFKVRR